MIKINENMYIVYNANKTIVLFKDNREADIPSYIRIFNNEKDFSNEYLELNVDKKLSIKDKLVELYKKSPLNRTFYGEYVFCGHIFKAKSCNEELEPQFKQIYETLEKSILDGEIEQSSYMFYHQNFSCSNNDVEDLFYNFEKLEEKHRKDKQEVVEEELEN